MMRRRSLRAAFVRSALLTVLLSCSHSPRPRNSGTITGTVTLTSRVH